MPRHVVCLTYDFDALSLPIAKGATSPTALSRGEFGLVGVERIRLLLRDRRIPATFFVPGHTIESFPGSVAPLVEAGHEIGHHGWTHRRPNSSEVRRLGKEGVSTGRSRWCEYPTKKKKREKHKKH